jgi:hypothetical protein
MLNIFITLTVCIKLILSKSCPKYQCHSSTNSTCAIISPNNAVGYATIALFDACSDTEACTAQPIQMLQYITDSNSYNCEKFDFRVYRLPGEDCDHDSDCHSTLDEKCDPLTKKCIGSLEGDECEDTSQCIAGLYCDRFCKRLRLKGDKCTSSKQCTNALLCYNGTCSVAPYSLPSGTVVPKDDYYPSSYYCDRMYSYIDENSNAICAELVQVVPEGDEYIKCNYGDTCHYKVGTTSVHKDCEYGLNAEGQGYCPLGQNLSNYNF